MSLKEIIDKDKPYFDYAGNLLRIAAWFIAVSYVINSMMRPQPPGNEFYVAAVWGAITVATMFGFFMCYRIAITTKKAVEFIVDQGDQKGFKSELVRFILYTWLMFGLPAFTIALSLELIEQFITKGR
ncbi:hypothetical protein PUR29_37075 [Methylobacterium ajmalii]|uniref:Uncharacterized protein n=1 Tax=Methylobacterium ajmalii TaxID=2738439 RepID=A0ABV0A750_9HYPH